jgi:hypothetical protein
VNLSPITAKPKLDSVREAFHVDELRKGDKFEEFRFEVQTNGMFGLSLIMPTNQEAKQTKTSKAAGFLFAQYRPAWRKTSRQPLP